LVPAVAEARCRASRTSRDSRGIAIGQRHEAVDLDAEEA